jgi:hypothetical protein
MLGKCLLGLILNIGFLLGSAYGLNFKQVAYIPSGMMWNGGCIKGYDFNHDGYQNLAFSIGSPPIIVYYGYRSFNRYVFEDSVGPSSFFWDVGDMDGDSLIDVLAAGNTNPLTYRVFEPTNYLSFPKNRVWEWRCEYMGNYLQSMYITDLDRDGFKEILTADAQVVYVFENRGDNQYQKVYSDTTSRYLYFSPSMAFGDYDNDGSMEFVRTSSDGGPDTTVFVYECSGNDQYQKVWGGYLLTPNMHDCITGPDLDGDGKLEFIIGSLRTGSPSPWKGCLWIYESTGPNQYSIIYSDSISVTDRGGYSVHSDCGDVDQDGKPELVWAIDRDWMVYKSPGNNQFQRVFSAYGDNGHNSTNIHIHDMNGNGYPEVIESGGNETHIWEVEACRLLYPNGGETLYGDSLAVIRWRNVDPFQADSFSLFYSSDSGLTYSPVAHGVPGSDSAYTWTVPRTFSDDCFVMLWAYQNATGWDFSGSHFRIRNGNGVEQGQVVRSSFSYLPYRVAPNPFVSFATLPGHEREQFALYDVSGRKMGNYPGSRIGYNLSAGIYFLKPEVKDAKPIRLVKLR